MLKKYKQSAILLSAQQLKATKGGIENAQRGIKCNVASDCGSTFCVEANSFMWTCDNKRCTMWFCEGPGVA